MTKPSDAPAWASVAVIVVFLLGLIGAVSAILTALSLPDPKPSPKTAGPVPAYQQTPHPCEKRRNLPLYLVEEHSDLGYASHTTRAVKVDEYGLWYVWRGGGYWAIASDRRTDWDRKYGYGEWTVIYLIDEEGRKIKQVYPDATSQPQEGGAERGGQ